MDAEQVPLPDSVSAHLRLFLLHRRKRALLQVRGQTTTTTRRPPVYRDIAAAPNFEEEDEENELPEDKLAVMLVRKAVCPATLLVTGSGSVASPSEYGKRLSSFLAPSVRCLLLVSHFIDD